MNKPSQGQVLNAISVLINNTDWNAVDASILQKVIDNPKDAGRELTLFLKNGGRVITIDRTNPFDPVPFIGPGSSILEQDNRSLLLTEVDLTKIKLQTTLEADENSVQGEENLKRLIKVDTIRLDAKVFQTFWENPSLIPENFKQLTNGETTYVFFPGTVLRHSRGHRYVLYLYWNDGEWRWGYHWLAEEWHADSPSAVLES